MKRNWWKPFQKYQWMSLLSDIWDKISDCVSITITQQRKIHQQKQQMR